MLALACAPSALADDSLLGPVTAPTAAVAVGEVVESVVPVAVEVPAMPVPAVTAAVVETASMPAAAAEKALPPLPEPATPVAAVAERVTAVARAAVPASGAATREAAVARPRGTISKRLPPARERALPSRGRSASAGRAVDETVVPRRAPEATTTSPAPTPLAVPSLPARDATMRSPLPSPEKLVHKPARDASPKPSTPLPVPSAPARSSTPGVAAGGIDGFWPVCAGLLFLALLGRRLGPRVLQLVPEPHPHAFLLRLERPG